MGGYPDSTIQFHGQFTKYCVNIVVVNIHTRRPGVHKLIPSPAHTVLLGPAAVRRFFTCNKAVTSHYRITVVSGIMLRVIILHITSRGQSHGTLADIHNTINLDKIVSAGNILGASHHFCGRDFVGRITRMDDQRILVG